jgi:hypothetical protein
MKLHEHHPRANKTDAGNGSEAICRVSNVLRSPSPDPGRYPTGRSLTAIAIRLVANLIVC